MKYLATNSVRGLLTVLAVTMIVFFLARVTGDPMDVLAPEGMSVQDEMALRERWELDGSISEQYVAFLRGAIQGDLGESFTYPSQSATEVILNRLPNSIKLGAVATLITVVVGVPLGVAAALKRGTFIDSLARGLALFGQSVPEFWLGIVLIWLIAVEWSLLPTSGLGGLQNYILPSICISVFGIAALLRLFRSSMLETLDSEYVKLARLKGIAQAKVVWKHAFKPALIAPLTFFGTVAIRMLTGATVIEVVFNWPGVGLLAFEAAQNRDFPVVQALALFTAVIIVVMNLAIDVAYTVIDPRVRLGEKAEV